MPDESFLERYVRSWSDTYSLGKTPGLFLPFVVFAVLKLAALLLVWFFWKPGLSAVLAPLLGSLAGEEALHFPGHVEMLPSIFRTIDLFAVLTVGFALYTWGVFMMIDVIDGRMRRPLDNLADVAVAIPSILIIGFLFAMCALVLPASIDSLAGFFERRPKVQFLIAWSAFFVTLGFHALFVYAPFFLKREGGTALDAVWRSMRYAREQMTITSTIVVTVLIIRWPFSYLASQTNTLLATGKGEWVLIYLMLGVLTDVLAIFYLFAATTGVVMEWHRAKAGRNG